MSVLTPAQIYQYVTGAGFSGSAATTATAIALAESGGNTAAYNPGNTAADPTGDTEKSYGIFQINLTAHPGVTAAQAQDPAFAANYAHQLYQASGNTFSAWGTWLSGAYQQFMGTATAAAGAPPTTVQGTTESSAGPLPWDGGTNPFPTGTPQWIAWQLWHVPAGVGGAVGSAGGAAVNAASQAASQTAAGWASGFLGAVSSLLFGGNAPGGLTGTESPRDLLWRTALFGTGGVLVVAGALIATIQTSHAAISSVTSAVTGATKTAKSTTKAATDAAGAIKGAADLAAGG